MEMYAGRIPVNHNEYVRDDVHSINVRKQNGTDRQTDGHQTETLCLPLKAASIIKHTHDYMYLHFTLPQNMLMASGGKPRRRRAVSVNSRGSSQSLYNMNLTSKH